MPDIDPTRKRRLLTYGAVACGLLILGTTIYAIRHIGASAWIYNRTTDPMTDVPTAGIQTNSADGAILEVSCTNGAPLRLIIRARHRLFYGREDAVERVIKFRFDERPVADTVGELRGEFIGFDDIAGKSWHGPIIAGLPDSDKLAVKYAEGGFVFPTTGAGWMIEKVREGCKPNS